MATSLTFAILPASPAGLTPGPAAITAGTAHVTISDSLSIPARAVAGIATISPAPRFFASPVSTFGGDVR